ncbi:hypothetical protein CY658_10930 [Variovorax sp. RO1]|uniref:hypothetical protein n=1 Tax=Variovorax sp. RO1 TaxID=2066034 RepID=UPI000C7179AD|nr:hypothetical protein [Variovorax sp. RO1]PLC07458.1 hypothetical protein CY658_10930 [Variovorax sp. RO1]
MEARAQVNPEIANCVELKDEATVTQADLCSAHIGCRFVLSAQKTCARAKGYLERLQVAIGEGTRTFFGYHRKEVTPDAVFTAVLNGDDRENERKLGGLAQPQRLSQEIGARVREVGTGDTLSGKGTGDTSWVYYGQVKDGKADGSGTRVFSDGEIQRGQFSANRVHGAADMLYAPNGNRYVGEVANDNREGQGLQVLRDGGTKSGNWSKNASFQGTFLRADGTRFEGSMSTNWRTQGREYRADGTLAEEGRYESGKLSVGTQHDVAGVRTEVNLPGAREAATREAAEKSRLAAEAEKQRKREEVARAEQQFQAGLQTMNPGQLFARADELNAQGDRARAREVQRALMSRFPDHPLAATAARQMTGESGGSAAANGGSTPGGAANRPAGTRLSSQTCEAMKQSVIATKVPSNASITASQETVMFMTKTVLDMIAANCPTEPGVTPAQIAAERQTRQQQYTAAENACNAVQSGGRRCVAQNHFGPGAAPRPTETRGPIYACEMNEKVGPDVIQSYDPVKGRTTCQRIYRAGQSSGSATSSSTAGGGTSRVSEDNRTCRNCTAN